MYGGKMMGILGERCWGWNSQETPKRFMDVVREDMAVAELTDEDTDDRTKCKICCSDN